MDRWAVISWIRSHPRAVAGLTALCLVLVLSVLTNPSVILHWLDRTAEQPLVFLLFLAGFALIRPALAWPTTLIPIAAGYAMGILGILPSAILLTLTGLAPYLVAKQTGSSGRIGTAGKELVSITGGFRGVAASRLFPLPSDVVSIGAGVAGVRLRAYVAGTFVGEFPWAVLGVIIGISIDQLVAGEVTSAFDPWLLAGMSAVGIMLLAGPLYRHVRPPPIRG